MKRYKDIGQTLRKVLRETLRAQGVMGLMGFILMALWSCSKDHAESEPEPGPEPPLQEAIRFSGDFQEESDVVAGTRAETSLSTVKKSFKVWAFKNMGVTGSNPNITYTNSQLVIPGYTVKYFENSANTTTTNSNNWEYVGQEVGNEDEQTIKYWDFDAKAYRYFGVTPTGDDVTNTDGVIDPYVNLVYTIDNGNGTKTTFEAYDDYKALINTNAYADKNSYVTFSISADAREEEEDENATPYISRLWFSNGHPVDYSDKQFGQPVKLQFYKPFAKVRFMFTYSENLKEEVEKGDFLVTDKVFAPTDHFAGIALSGTLNFSFPLTGTGTKESWDITPDVYSDNIYFTQDWYSLTPAQLASTDPKDAELIANNEKWYIVMPANDQGSYTLTANINGADQTAIVPAEFMQWDPGYSYTYIFKIVQDGDIKFDEVQVAIKQWVVYSKIEHSVHNW